MAIDAVVDSFRPGEIDAQLREYLDRVTVAATAATAAAMLAVVYDAAAVTVVEQSQADALVTQSATAAASGVAAAADVEAVTSDSKIAQAAVALRGVALQTCYQVAINVAASAAEAVLADGMPDTS